jgi:hypothetical protein
MVRIELIGTAICIFVSAAQAQSPPPQSVPGIQSDSTDEQCKQLRSELSKGHKLTEEEQGRFILCITDTTDHSGYFQPVGKSFELKDFLDKLKEMYKIM